MSSPEISEGMKAELEPIKLPLRVAVFMKGIEMVNRHQERKRISAALREAIAFREKAELCTNAEQSKRGRLWLSAGQAFLNGRQTNQALECLEEARPAVELDKMQGNSEGFSRLADLYQALEFAYEQAGRKEESEGIRTKAEELAREKELHFGIKTEFLPNGGRLINHVPIQAE